MKSKAKPEFISLVDAMENLTQAASLQLPYLDSVGIVGKRRIVLDPKEFPESEVIWLSGEGGEAILEIIDESYKALHVHLVSVLEQGEPEIDERTLRGVAAMMAVANEAAIRLQAYLKGRLGHSIDPITDRPDFQSLLRFYERYFAKKIEKEEVREAGADALKDIESVKKDRDYELFYIRKEDGSPYFDLDLLRHVRLTTDLGGEEFEEDPLLQVRSMCDRDLHVSAGQILGVCHQQIAEFYHLFRKFSSNEFAVYLSEALTALFLCANPKNLVQNTFGKSAFQYFHDFLEFLRSAFRSSEYQRLIAYPPSTEDKGPRLLLQLAHGLAFAFFHRVGGVKQETIGLIHRIMRKGSEESKGVKKKMGDGWSQLLVDDENYRTRFQNFPNGPLFKILDLIRTEEGGEVIPFDPLFQDNLPSKLFEMDSDGKSIEVLRIPCPTRQAFVQKSEVVEEFRAFLRYELSKQKPKRHLFINLQDRTSWKEFARCKALEELQKNAEFNQVCSVLTLPKNTDFYYQTAEYEAMDQASDFFAAFHGQLSSAEECGFFLPTGFATKDLARFGEMILPLIHDRYFEKKKVLKRREREDFIEIFHLFLLLQIIEQMGPVSMSFTCKDGVDTGAIQGATFFAFLKILEGEWGGRESVDFFRWLLYTPALYIRERAPDNERVARALTALDRLASVKQKPRKGLRIKN